MKSYLALLVLIGFVGLAVFGFVDMASVGEHSGPKHETCLASAVQQLDCPKTGGSLLALALFHTSAYRSFSLAKTEGPLLLLLILTLFTLSLVLLFSNIAPRAKPLFSVFSKLSPYSIPKSGEIALVHWLALKEASPTK